MEPSTPVNTPAEHHSHKGLFVSIIIFAFLLVLAFFVWQFAMPKPVIKDIRIPSDVMTDVRPENAESPSIEDKVISAEIENALSVDLESDLQAIDKEF